jgi:hypothetical protein
MKKAVTEHSSAFMRNSYVQWQESKTKQANKKQLQVEEGERDQ